MQGFEEVLHFFVLEFKKVWLTLVLENVILLDDDMMYFKKS
jgi:hypothetical protein